MRTFVVVCSILLLAFTAKAE